MKKLLKYTVRGNTIIEVLIALAILTFCSSLAIIIYLNIQKSSLPFFKVKAVELAAKYMEESIARKNYSETTFKEEEFFIKRIANRHSEFQDCLLINVTIFDATKKKIFELEEVILNEQ